MRKNETKELLDLALHPTRMRILTLLSGSQGLTPQQMAERMDDIPQATLYRHINRLAQGGLLAVVTERPVRGTLEKVYALNTAYDRQLVTGEDALEAFNRLSKEDHLRYFNSFLLSLLDAFSHYLDRAKEGQLNMAADGVGYHTLPLFMSDEELAQFAAALNQALVPFLGLKDAPGRRKRLFSTVMMPVGDPAEPDNDSHSSRNSPTAW
jgi:DNA-binding transcriptional ArsR family regulator